MTEEFNKTLQELWDERVEGEECVCENERNRVFNMLGLASSGGLRAVGLIIKSDGTTDSDIFDRTNPIWRRYTPPKSERKWYKLAWVELLDGRRTTPFYWHISREKARECLSDGHIEGPMQIRTESDWETEDDSDEPS